MPASNDFAESVVLLDVVLQVEDLLNVVVFLFLTKKLKFHREESEAQFKQPK